MSGGWVGEMMRKIEANAEVQQAIGKPMTIVRWPPGPVQIETKNGEGEAEIRRVEYPVVVAERMALNVIRQVKRDVVDFRARMASEDQAVRENAHEAFVANPSSMLCSPLYCRAWGSAWCPESVARLPKEESEEM